MDKSVEFVSTLAEAARQDVYSAFNVKAGRGYTCKRARLSQSVIRDHVANKQPIAVYSIVENGTRIAVLDVDNHDSGMSWDETVEAVRPISLEMAGHGLRPIPFRSGGGAGIHIWLIWEKMQVAADVRAFLRELINSHGFENGTAGLSKGEIEIYPKQDKVKKDSVGNPIALPLARKSVPLSADLKPLALGDFVPPQPDTFFSADVPSIAKTPDGTESKHPDHNNVATLNEVLDGDEEEVEAALGHISSEQYDTWIRAAIILKNSLGEKSYECWCRWSETSNQKYPGEAECREIWEKINPNGTLRLGSLFHMAREEGWNGPTDRVIREMNARFGILTHKNKTLIILKNGEREKDDEFDWLTKPTFEDRLAAEKIKSMDSEGNPKLVSKARKWLSHPRASHFHKVNFDPTKQPGANGKTWNTWRGFGVEPIPGSWDLLRDHILENICSGDDQLAGWLFNWMALGVQQPGLVIGTAPVLHGFPGTGKGFLANAYGRLWGSHYTTITHHEHVSGRFNNHLFAKRFAFIDEGIFGGNRRDAGVIKTRITEKWLILEAKGVDPIKIRNRLIFMIASNEDSIVRADLSDRRWQMFEVGNRNREDHAYFRSIQNQLNDGGYEAMLFDLLQRNLNEGPDPQRIMRSEALFDQIIQAQAADVRYLHQILDNGYLPQSDVIGNGPGVTTIKALWDDLQATQANSQYVSMIRLGRFIHKVIRNVDTTQNGSFVVRYDMRHGQHQTERSTRYIFPPLSDCRAAFESFVGAPVAWPAGKDQWEVFRDDLPI